MKQIEEAVIAIPSLTGKEMRSIIQLCDRCRDIAVKQFLPSVISSMARFMSTRYVRSSIEDLLGREQVELNREQIREYLTGKRVLVTGAAGSIGSELCRQIMKMEPEQLILYERVENEIYRINNGVFTDISGKAI